MLYRLIFKKMPLHKKHKYIHQYGVTVGTRYNGERTVYLYMIKNFFVEVTYTGDLATNPIEDFRIFSNHKELNQYLVSS